MIRIGITGQSGFIGTHLYNSIGLLGDKFIRVLFEDSFFSDQNELLSFIRECDVIVHLAAVNRHEDPAVIYQTNIRLVKQIIDACETTKSTPHILFSSSIQEDRDNVYGRSKRDGRLLFEQWASRNNASFTALLIPNVFGPFGNPNFNSVVATFCYKLTHDSVPQIETDGELKLIYVADLIKEIIIRIELLKSKNSKEGQLEYIQIPFTTKIKVSELLALLENYKYIYIKKGEMPSLDNNFERNLFHTFLCFIEHSSFFPFKLKLNIDQRGTFVETLKLNSGGQISFSTTIPGVTRGNHFHTRKAERFTVIKGRAEIKFRRIGTNRVCSFLLDGKEPGFVDIPIWHTHNITNIGEDELYTIFWTNEHFEANDPDTYFEGV